MKTKTTVPVSMRALVQRINRQLKKDNEQLRKARGRDQYNIGDWFTLDLYHNAVARTYLDPEKLGRELGVLRPWECVED
jgi:hypothetical protein